MSEFDYAIEEFKNTVNNVDNYETWSEWFKDVIQNLNYVAEYKPDLFYDAESEVGVNHWNEC